MTDCHRCLQFVRLYRFYFKLSKMLSKKKNAVTPSKNHHSSSKPAIDNKLGLRKSYQKHSRKGTKDYQPIDLQSLVNARLYRSARELINHNLLLNINSIIFGYSSPFSLQLKEAMTISDNRQHLNSYCFLSKHRSYYLEFKTTIQAALVEAIQGKNPLQFISRPNMHFEAGVYHIMNQHIQKKKKYIKKIATFQTQSSVHRQPTPFTKQLPTLVSDRDHEESDISAMQKLDITSDRKGLNTSESFQLKKLTECIKEMFNKQLFDGSRDKIVVWPGGKSSWLLQGKSIEKKILLECDFSSIQSNSKYEIQTDSKVKDIWSSDVEENYGLGTLRRRYQEQKLSKLKQASQINNKMPLGHKRNPTETLHTKQHFLGEPMTPKESCRSVFASTQNILLNSPKRQKSKSKKKDFEVNEAYLLRFEKKKKQNGIPHLKQNAQKQKSKIKNQGSKTRSKEKLKFTSKRK